MKSLPKSKVKRKSSSRRYSLERSCFYRLERRSDLAALLRVSEDKLNDLIASREELYRVREELVGNKIRQLQVPRGDLRRCHGRLLSLFRRIQLPEYIRSPRKGSSAWQNAATHVESDFITSFDIKSFYPSTTEEHVFRLFKYRFCMSDDCARILAQLCTFGGILAQGSPVSPHLASLTHLDIFEDAGELCIAGSNSLSIWVDDVTVSGPSPRRDVVNLIKRRAREKGLKTHKDRKGGGRRGIELTGSYIRNRKIAVANSSHLKIRDTTRELAVTIDPAARYALFNKLLSMTRYQRTVIKSSSGDTQRLSARINYYKREMEKLSRVLSVTEPSISAAEAGLQSDGEAF